jgi:uncharacterized protein with HEPN domain
VSERDRQLFEDVVEFADRAVRILADRSHDVFVADETILYSVRYCVMVVGECANELSPAGRARCPAVPWHHAAATRHRLVHGYNAVTDRIIFNTVRDDLPGVLTSVRALLAATDSGNGAP